MCLSDQRPIKDLSSFFEGHVSSDSGDRAVLVVHKHCLLLSSLPYKCFAVFLSMHGCIDGSLFVVLPIIFGITSPMTTVDHFLSFLLRDV